MTALAAPLTCMTEDADLPPTVNDAVTPARDTKLAMTDLPLTTVVLVPVEVENPPRVSFLPATVTRAALEDDTAPLKSYTGVDAPSITTRTAPETKLVDVTPLRPVELTRAAALLTNTPRRDALPLEATRAAVETDSVPVTARAPAVLVRTADELDELPLTDLVPVVPTRPADTANRTLRPSLDPAAVTRAPVLLVEAARPPF